MLAEPPRRRVSEKLSASVITVFAPRRITACLMVVGAPPRVRNIGEFAVLTSLLAITGSFATVRLSSLRLQSSLRLSRTISVATAGRVGNVLHASSC